MFDVKENKYPLVDRQEKMIAMTEGTDNCMNTTAALRIHGKLDFKKLEQAIQSVVDQTDALRFVFTQDENGKTYQSILDSYEYHLDVQVAEGDTAEEKERFVFAYSRQIAEQIRNFDGDIMFHFVLFQLETDDYILLEIVNHIITDGISNNIIFMKIIATYNGVPVPQAAGSYLDFIKAEEEFVASEAGQEQIAYWQKESLGYEESFFPQPKAERKKSAVKTLFAVDLQPVYDFARKNKVSMVAVNTFLCHAALSGAFQVKDTGIGVGDSNRSKQFRETIGFLVTRMLDRFIFESQETMQEAFSRFVTKYQTNMKKSRLGNYSVPALITFSYLNYQAPIENIMFGDAKAEPYIGLHETKIWDSMVLIVTETPDKLIYKVGCDEDVFSNEKQQKFHEAFLLALQCLVEQDMTFESFCKEICCD